MTILINNLQEIRALDRRLDMQDLGECVEKRLSRLPLDADDIANLFRREGATGVKNDVENPLANYINNAFVINQMSPVKRMGSFKTRGDVAVASDGEWSVSVTLPEAAKNFLDCFYEGDYPFLEQA